MNLAKKPYHWVVTLLVLLSCSYHSFAQHTFQQRPWQQPRRRHTSSSSSSAQQQLQQQRAAHDYRSHYLDDENWMTDKISRAWNVRIDRRKPGQSSWVSRIILANVVAYAVQTINPGFTQWGVKLSDKILRGEELYRLVSPVFLHGSIYHLFTNMYSLNNVGKTCEQMFGPGRFLVSYLAAGAAGNLLSAMKSPNPALGASGAVFGVMASFYVFLNRHEWLLGRQGKAYSDAVTQTLMINMVLGYMNPMIDNWGHLGGAIGGAAMAYYFGPRLFLAELPNGGTTIVDKPILRLPRSLESIPEKTGKRISRMLRRMQVWKYKADLPEKPWRSKETKPDYRQRMGAPNKSIKPRIDG
jgi:membrane associated rhomboid family serine protease